MFLAFSETLGKSAQTNAISHTVEASNLWAFFQAKSIRRTTVLTAAEGMTAELPAASSEPVKASMTRQIDSWQKTAARYRSEPDIREGTVELADRAKQAEARRDTAMARYHHYEVASAAFQIAIVLASSTVITGVLLLTYLAGGLGAIGLIFLAIGLLAPTRCTCSDGYPLDDAVEAPMACARRRIRASSRTVRPARPGATSG